MNSNNLAQKTNFTAGSDKLQLSMLFLSTVTIPGMSLSHIEKSSRSGTVFNISADTIEYNDLSFEILIDEQFLVYKEFTDKIFKNISPTSGSFANTEFDFWVEVANSDNVKLFRMDFNSCRIESIGDIELDTTSDETEFLLSVEVKYDYYSIDYGNNIIPTLAIK